MKYKLIYIFILLCLVALLSFQSYKVIIYSNTIGIEVSITFSKTYQLYHEVLVSFGEGTIDSIDDSEVIRMLSEFGESTVLNNKFDMYRIKLISGTIIELIESTDIEEQKELYEFALELEEETGRLIEYAFELSGGEKGFNPDGDEIVLRPGDSRDFAPLCNENSANYKKFDDELDEIFNRQYSKLKLIVDKYSE